MKRKQKVNIRKRRLISLCIACLIMMSATPSAYAASVKVTIPTFSVTINGTVMNNAYSEYPCIVYKGITYFPMTYYDCRFLGLETDWKQATGLTIAKTGTQWEYKPYTRTAKNGSSYTAATASGTITVNGECINNSQETYPLLQFRGVTYFPLTWRFAVDSFGWNYEYTDAKGLVINSGASTGAGGANESGSTSANAKEVILPVAKFEWEYEDEPSWGGFVQHGGYYYYQGEEGHIYQAPVSNPAQRKSVHRLPERDFYYDGYRQAEIYVEKSKVYLFYHVGGAVMGHDELYLLGEDGSCTEITPQSYYTYRDFGSDQVYADHWMGGGALSYKTTGQSEYTDVKWQDKPLHCTMLGPNAHRGGSKLIVAGAEYVTRMEDGEEYTTRSDDYYLYEVDYRAGTWKKLCDTKALQYDIKGDTVYFINPDDGAVYKVAASGGKAEKLATGEAVSELVVLDNAVLAANIYDGKLYKAGQTQPLTEGKIATLTQHNGYAKVTFVSGSSLYKAMLFDSYGNEVAKTIESLVDLYVQDGVVVFVKNQ